MIEKISTEKLNWNKKTKTLSAEVSTALDGGLLTSNMVEVESHHTGQVKIFELISEHKDRELEITHWKFESRATPEIKLVLWND